MPEACCQAATTGSCDGAGVVAVALWSKSNRCCRSTAAAAAAPAPRDRRAARLGDDDPFPPPPPFVERVTLILSDFPLHFVEVVQLTARRALSWFANVTNAKPRDAPSSLFVAIRASATAPNFSPSTRASSSSFVRYATFPTNTLLLPHARDVDIEFQVSFGPVRIILSIEQ